MSTALPLFWHLSSLSKKERVDASVKLLSALQQFQTQFCPKDPDATSDSDEGEQVQPKSSSLDVLNAPDVSYSIRRLIRGLASPRESSRLGFAVALTEVRLPVHSKLFVNRSQRLQQLLSRLDTITCSQILTLVIECSQTQGSMSGQEVRDVLFARLFGLTAIIRSGLLFRQTPLPNTTNSPSNVDNYREAVAHLLTLGEKKSWLRESAWWSFGMAVDALLASEVPWKDEAVESTYVSVFSEQVPWTPEKVALAAKLRTAHPSRDWRSLLGPTLKHPDLLDTANFGTLSKILKVRPFRHVALRSQPQVFSGNSLFRR
jgi:DNA polymerase phi